MSTKLVIAMTKVRDIMQKMLNYNIQRFEILENEKLVENITQTDLTEFLPSIILINASRENIK